MIARPPAVVASPEPPARAAVYVLVGVFAILVPVALAVAVFPTPHTDARESFVWGRFLPLATHKHPPMMAWVARLAELGFGPTGLSAVLVSQLFDCVGIAYLHATLRLVVDRRRALLFALLFATSAYFLAAPLSYALNADLLQIPAWGGVVYHLVRARQTNRLGHWLALGIWSAAAFYTKYTAALLFFSIAVASLAVAEFRSLWRNPRLYAAAALFGLLAAPHLISISASGQALLYGSGNFALRAGAAVRLSSVGELVGGTWLFLLPASVILPLGLLSRSFSAGLPRSSPSPVERFLTLVAVAGWGALVVLILVFGLYYHARFGAPFLGLLVLALAPRIVPEPSLWPATERRVLATCAAVSGAVLVVASVAYTFFASHNYLQEPVDAAAATLREEWNRRFPCGPAYYLGDPPSAHGLALSSDRGPVGLPVVHLSAAPWSDEARLRREGAILVYRRPIPADEVSSRLPGAPLGETRSLTLDLLRNRTGATITYHYAFLAPESCPVLPAHAAHTARAIPTRTDPRSHDARTPHLQHELRERLPSVRPESGTQEPHEGGG